VLSMVSSLEVPTVATESPSSRAANGRTIKRVPFDKSSRTVKTDIQPDHYSFLGLDDFAHANRKHHDYDVGLEYSTDAIPDTSSHAPAIDSEILYEGITSLLSSDGFNLASASVAETVSPKNEEPILSAARTSMDEEVLKSELADGVQSTPLPKQKPNRSTKTKESRNKSSTMPGFIKDPNLDSWIVQKRLRRLPSPDHRKHLLRKTLVSDTARRRRRASKSAMLYEKTAAVPDSLIAYAGEIHAVERVTPREEKELGTRTQEAMRLQRLRDELHARYGREPTDDEWCAAAGKINAVALRETIEDGVRAKNHLVASNLRMVQRVVNLYIRNGLGSEYNAGDLMQDGTMALIRAAEKYEPQRGFRFSTYAMYWIRSAVKRSQTSQSSIINTPQRLHETHKRISKNSSRLRKELGHEPSKEELAKASNVTMLQMDRCQRAMSSSKTYSLEAEVMNTHKPNSPQSRKDTMYDVVKARVDKTEYERMQRLLVKEHLIETLRQHLLPHEVDLLLLRYGLMDERALPEGMSGPLTIAAVSSLVGLKPDKVRRIIINSQKQLKHLMKEWEDFDYELA